MKGLLMMFDLILSELKLQTNNLMFYLLLLISIFVGLMAVKGLQSDNGVLAWGPYYLTRLLLTVGFLIPVIQSIFVVKATVRDAQYHMEELTFTTSISKFKFLLYRWLGVFIPSLLAYFSFLIGICIGLILVSLEVDIPIDHNLLLSTLTWVSTVFMIPAMLLSSVLLFTLGLFSRSSLKVYIAAGLSFFLYQILSAITGSPMMAQPFVLNETLKLVFDFVNPMATSEFYQQVKHWSMEERNSQQVMLNGSLMVNRLLLMLLTIGSALLVYKFYSLTLRSSKKIKHFKKINIKIENNESSKITLNPIFPAKKSSSSAFFSLMKYEYLASITTKTFILISAICAFMIGSNVLSTFTYQETLGVTSLATTTIAINEYISNILPKLSSLFLVLFSAEIMWRDKELHIGDLIDVTPISNVQRFMAKWSALVFIPFTFITLAIVISVFLQLFFGGVIEPLLYLSLYIYVGLPLICVATLLLFINALSPNKITAIGLSLVVVILSQSNLGQFIGLEHGIFKFGTSPQLIHSELVGFSATSDAFWGYMMLWGSISVLLVLTSFFLMNRGHSKVTIKSLRKINFKQVNPALTSVFILFSLSTLFATANIYYQTKTVGNYVSNNDHNQWKANYEDTYGKYQGLKQPTVIDVTTEIDLFPSERRYVLKGKFILQNKTEQLISEVLINTHKDVTYTNVELKNATLKTFDPSFNQYIFTLNEPLQPLETVELTFNASRTHNGYNGTITDSFVTKDFVYFLDVRYVPKVGFSKHLTLKNEMLRAHYGLIPLPPEKTIEEDIIRYNGDFSFQYQWATIETKISTHIDHIAVAPGELLRHVVLNNRNVYHYKTVDAVRHIQAIVSGKLSLSQRMLDGTNLEVYHLEKHTKIAQEHLDSMADTLAYGNKHFGQYQAKQLRVIEMPNVLKTPGYAMPQTILLDERYGFSVDRKNTKAFDHLYRRTSHETAHQWWAHSLDSAITEGSSVLSETISNYTQAQLLKQKYGAEYHNRFMQWSSDRYFMDRGQTTTTEKPLYRTDEHHILYSKGTIAMNALGKKLGTDKINEALKILLKNHRYPKKPATSLDFIHALNSATNFKQEALINYWLKEVAVNDWKIETAELSMLDNSKYQVSVCLSNKLGASYPELEVELGLFTENPVFLYDKPKDQRTLMNRTIKIDSTKNCFKYQVPDRPNFVSIDPYYQTLDQERENNLMPLTLINKIMEKQND
jgi:hypothetical protein